MLGGQGGGRVRPSKLHILTHERLLYLLSILHYLPVVRKCRPVERVPAVDIATSGDDDVEMNEVMVSVHREDLARSSHRVRHNTTCGALRRGGAMPGGGREGEGRGGER